jgi:glycosyltransferase involved in cell wall biosynthesis
MPKLWQLVDASLVLLKRCDLFKTVIPSKIFESMAMSIPIVLGVEGEVAEIIENSKSGLCIEPENAAQLAKAVLEFHNNTNSEFGQIGLVFVSRAFDRDELALQFLSILERLNSNTNTPFGGTVSFPSSNARSI